MANEEGKKPIKPETMAAQLKERFVSLMQMINDGRQEQAAYVLSWLESTDFFKAPASTRYHLSVPCGLLQHSLNVYDAMMSMVEEVPDEEVEENSRWQKFYRLRINGNEVARFSHNTLILVTLCHDVCKAKFYVEEPKNKKEYSKNGSKHDSLGRFDWIPYMGYTVNDELPYGHGEKSVMLLQQRIFLSMDEIMAIRWHMGAYGLNDGDARNFSEACRRFPLVQLLHTADQMAGIYLEVEEGNKVFG